MDFEEEKIELQTVPLTTLRCSAEEEFLELVSIVEHIEIQQFVLKAKKLGVHNATLTFHIFFKHILEILKKTVMLEKKVRYHILQYTICNLNSFFVQFKEKYYANLIFSQFF